MHISNVMLFNPVSRRGIGGRQGTGRWASRPHFPLEQRSGGHLVPVGPQDRALVMARLKQLYDKDLVPKLKTKLGLENSLEVPRISKITLNMGVGEAINDKKIVDKAMQDLMMISGQKPMATKARKSVATSKIRQANDAVRYFCAGSECMNSGSVDHVAIPRIGISAGSIHAHLTGRAITASAYRSRLSSRRLTSVMSTPCGAST